MPRERSAKLQRQKHASDRELFHVSARSAGRPPSQARTYARDRRQRLPLSHALITGAPAPRPRAESYHCSGVGRTGSPGRSRGSREGRMNPDRTIAQMLFCPFQTS